VTAAAFSPDSRLLVTGDLVGSMRIWTTEKAKKACGIQVVENAHDMGVQTCDFSLGKGATNSNFQIHLMKKVQIVFTNPFYCFRWLLSFGVWRKRLVGEVVGLEVHPWWLFCDLPVPRPQWTWREYNASQIFKEWPALGLCCLRQNC